MQTFGPFVKQLRKEKNFTLETLARKCGVRKGYLSGIENERVNPPSARTIRCLARVLGVDRKQLLMLGYIKKAPAEIRPDLEAFFAQTFQQA